MHPKNHCTSKEVTRLLLKVLFKCELQQVRAQPLLNKEQKKRANDIIKDGDRTWPQGVIHKKSTSCAKYLHQRAWTFYVVLELTLNSTCMQNNVYTLACILVRFRVLERQLIHLFLKLISHPSRAFFLFWQWKLNFLHGRHLQYSCMRRKAIRNAIALNSWSY